MSYQEQLDFISSKWADFSQEEKNKIALELSGKRNAEKLKVVLDGFMKYRIVEETYNK